jgi:hypothetical protein
VHSLPRNGRVRDFSGHGKKPTERVTPTSWRRQREGLVRTGKGTYRSRGTHVLETAERGTCQDSERNRLSEGHSRSRDGRERDLSGHREKSTERVTRTFWRWQREGLVRTRKKPNQVRGTHNLETAEGGTYKDTERNRLSEGHSPSGDGRERTGQDTDRNIPSEAYSRSGEHKEKVRSGARKECARQRVGNNGFSPWNMDQKGLTDPILSPGLLVRGTS